MATFSKSTTEILKVVEETRKTLILSAQLGRDIDEATVKEAVRTAISTAADYLGVTAWTVADQCHRKLETNTEGFENLIIDHFSGGDALADAVCAHCKMTIGEDNPANIRAALKALQF